MIRAASFWKLKDHQDGILVCIISSPTSSYILLPFSQLITSAEPSRVPVTVGEDSPCGDHINFKFSGFSLRGKVYYFPLLTFCFLHLFCRLPSCSTHHASLISYLYHTHITPLILLLIITPISHHPHVKKILTYLSSSDIKFVLGLRSWHVYKSRPTRCDSYIILGGITSRHHRIR